MATVEGNSNLSVYVPQIKSEFDTIDINISNFKEQDVLVRFTSKNNGGSVVYIDNVRMATSPLNHIAGFEVVSDFQIYPNPTFNYFVVETDDFIKHGYISIYNSVGQKLRQVKLLSKRTSINISDLSRGIYFIRSSNSYRSKPLIIE
ncbi:MAG: T9SS type A sorting domain-containing protein [Bacteroidales bacterium]|nr:T9SS type A sorting domain-containing protein [Bacteroidales bacterium]